MLMEEYNYKTYSGFLQELTSCGEIISEWDYSKSHALFLSYSFCNDKFDIVFLSIFIHIHTISM